MKNFTVCVVLLLTVLVVFCPAEADNFSGKWAVYRLFFEQDGIEEEYENHDFDVTFLDMGFIEFIDEKVYIKIGDEDTRAMSYRISGDKLAVDTSNEDNAMGMSIEIYSEGNDLICVVKHKIDAYDIGMKIICRKIRPADAIDLSGKWVNYRSYSIYGGRRWKENHEASVSNDGDLDSIEFRDGKAYFKYTNGNATEMSYKASDDIFVLYNPDDVNANGLVSIEAPMDSDSDIDLHNSEDEKVYIEIVGGNTIELFYDADSGKYVTGSPSEIKADKFESREFYFEGSDLVFVYRYKTRLESGYMKGFYRRPK